MEEAGGEWEGEGGRVRVLRGEEEGVEIPNSDETYFRLLYSLDIYMAKCVLQILTCSKVQK